MTLDAFFVREALENNDIVGSAEDPDGGAHDARVFLDDPTHPRINLVPDGFQTSNFDRG